MSILYQGVCLLAQFAFEKAVIADHMHLKAEDPFFTSMDRNRFRESFDIPDGVQMWLAAFCGRGRSGFIPSVTWRSICVLAQT